MATKGAGFDREWWVNRVREETGKSLSEQTLEMRQLAASEGRIQVEEYYEYGLYDDRLFDEAARAAFVGKPAWAIMARRFNEGATRDPGYDRVRALSYLSRKGAPVPLIYAIYQNEPSPNCQTEVISDADALGEFLRRRVTFPFVGTPVRLGTHGAPVTVHGYDKLLDCLILADERRVPVITFINAVRRHGDSGYVFEEAHRPYPSLMPVCGAHVTTVRAMVFKDDETYRIVRPIWIMPCTNTPQNLIGRQGNLVARLSPNSGVASGSMWQRGTVTDMVPHHPDTGAAIDNTPIPNWKQVTGLIRQYAAAFPRHGIQRWDVALTDRGPVVVWVGGQADIQSAQRVWRKGLLDGRLGQALLQQEAA